MQSTVAVLAVLALAGVVGPAATRKPGRRRRGASEPSAPPSGGFHTPLALFDAALCRLCRRNLVERADVCQSCRRTDAYRVKGRPTCDQLYTKNIPRDPPAPTAARPGSEEKIAVFQWRAMRGYAVAHPKDVVDRIDMCPRESPGVMAPMTNASKAMLRVGAGGDEMLVPVDEIPISMPMPAAELPSGVTSRGVRWSRLLPDGATRADIAKAITAHVGVIEDGDAAMEEPWRWAGVDDQFYEKFWKLNLDEDGVVGHHEN